MNVQNNVQTQIKSTESLQSKAENESFSVPLTRPVCLYKHNRSRATQSTKIVHMLF